MWCIFKSAQCSLDTNRDYSEFTIYSWLSPCMLLHIKCLLIMNPNNSGILKLGCYVCLSVSVFNIELSLYNKS